MTDAKPKIRKSIISGRELFLCDDLVEPIVQQQIAALVKTMHYVRAEKSRPDVPGAVAVCDIKPETVAGNSFLRGLRQTVERLFPNERFTDQRAYVNCSVYGDAYISTVIARCSRGTLRRFIMPIWNGSPIGAARPFILMMTRMPNASFHPVPDGW